MGLEREKSVRMCACGVGVSSKMQRICDVGVEMEVNVWG